MVGREIPYFLLGSEPALRVTEGGRLASVVNKNPCSSLLILEYPGVIEITAQEW